MSGYIRNKTRPQGDRPIYHKQKNYGDGLTVDIPKSDLNNNANPLLENYVAFERYLEGRSGSLEVIQLPFTGFAGELHDMKEHSKINVAVAHKGGKLLRVGLSTSEILDYDGASFGLDVDSRLKEFGGDFLLFTQSGIFRIVLSDSPGKFFQINGAAPLDVPREHIVTTEAPYKYKYVYTFSTLLDSDGELAISGDRLTAGNFITHETAPVLPSDSPDDLSYFRLFETKLKTDSLTSTAVYLGLLDTVSVPTYITHFSIYRTPDLGQNGLNNFNFEQFAWVGDMLLDKGDLLNTFFLDNIDDEILKARLVSGPRLSSVGFAPLPSGDVGEVTEGFVFSAMRNGKTVSYSQRIPDDTGVGFYNPAVQFFEVDDGVQVLAKTPDVLSILCNRKSYISSLTAFTNAGVFETVIALIHITIVDDTLGVTEPYSFVKVEQGTYISICSDKSVRIWDGGSWSRDFTENRVRTIIQEIKTKVSVGAYFRGAYILWFTRDNSSAIPDECLRLSVKRESGKGWTFYTGDNLVIPPAKAGPFVASDFAVGADLGFNFLYVFDEVGQNIYWMETFDCSNGLTLGPNILPAKKYWSDKVSVGFDGYNILPAVETREVAGSRESFNIILSEAHAYLRDLLGENEPILYPELQIDAVAFVDGNLNPIESVGKAESDGDIQWWYRVSGSRISIKFRATRSGHRLVGTDTRYRVQDILRPNRGPSNTVASLTNQQDFQQGLIEWHFTRPRSFLDRIRQIITPSGGISTTLAPDNRSKAIQIGVDEEAINRFRFKKSSIVTDDFTISFYIKNPDLGAGGNLALLTFKNASEVDVLSLVLVSSAEIKIEEGSGSVMLDNLVSAGPLGNGFHQIILIRSPSSSDVRVYQNNLLKGSLTYGDTFGGGEFELGSPTPP